MIEYQDYLIMCLAEECAEVAQRCMKAMRFGRDQIQTGHTETNAKRIEGELTDLIAVVDMLIASQVIDEPADPDKLEAKKSKVIKYYDMAVGLGHAKPL